MILGMLSLLTLIAFDDHGHSAPAKAAPKSDSSFIRVYKPGASESKEALEKLIAGNNRFVKATTKGPNRTKVAREHVATKQTPFASILACADSRVAPELVFDQGFGDLFVVRVAGNVADTFGIASLEYAAEHLGSKVIVVMGHERCGAVKAACDTFTAAHANKDSHGPTAEAVRTSIPALLDFIMPSVTDAAAKHPTSLLTAAIEANASRNAHEILEHSPLLAAMVAKGELTIVSGVYDLDTGKVQILK